MSAQPETPAEDAVNIEIDGRPYQARKGAMIIEVTDANRITSYNVCYTKLLRHAFIRGKLAALDAGVAEKVQILYGGSMNAGNAAELLAMSDIRITSYNVCYTKLLRVWPRARSSRLVFSGSDMM